MHDKSTRAETQTESLSDRLRGAMRRIAQPITLLTTRDVDGRPYGMAASAVMSVSMEPPSMSVAVNRASSIHPVLTGSRLFCINLLQIAQRELVDDFSRSDRRDSRFASSEWSWGPQDLPYFRSAQAAIFCATDASLDYATHTLHIGLVTDIKMLDDRLPLLWFGGTFAALAEPPTRLSEA